MPKKSYATPHCHIQSLDSASQPGDFAKREVELGTGAITCTDHGWLGAIPAVYELAKKNKLIPILGVEGYLRDDNCEILGAAGVQKDEKGTYSDYAKYYHFCVHCQDQLAYEALAKELSWSFMNRAERHGQEDKPLFDWRQLERIGGHNVTMTSGCLIGVVQRHLQHEQPELARRYYEKMRAMVKPGNFFVEIFPHKCTHKWEQGVYLKRADGTEKKWGQSKRLRVHADVLKEPVLEVKASELAAMFHKLKRDGGTVKLIAVKHYHKWEEQEPEEILDIREVEGFVENECRPWSGMQSDYQLGANRFMLEMARRYGDPILISDDSHFAYPEAKLVQDAKLTSGSHSWRFHNSYHRQSGDEAWQYFRDAMGVSERDFDEWVDNSYAFRDKFKDFKFKDRVRLASGRYPENTLRHLKSLIDKHGRMDWGNAAMTDRLKQEIQLLHKNGTIDLLPYFFLAEEVLDAYTQDGQLTGVGRGSSGGVLIDYLLGITHLNPLKYGLSLDRFLTLDRIKSGKLPDIDMDLPDRDFLIDPDNGWLIKNFGDKAAAISTKIGLRLKSSIKDVMRSRYGSVPGEIEGLCNRIPNPPQGINDEDWVFGYTADDGKEVRGFIEESPDLQEFVKKYPQEWEIVRGMLGIHRGFSRHASGWVIADEPISNFLPICKISGYPTTQYDMVGVEARGGLKMDFLGLGTLRWIQDCIKLIQERHGGGIRKEPMKIDGVRVWGHQQVCDRDGKWYSIWELPSDQGVYRDIVEGRSETVFQLNTKGAQQWMREFNHWVKGEEGRRKAIASIMDVANFTSLDRPGPLDAHVEDTDGIDGEPGKKYNMLQEYARRARGLPPIGDVQSLTRMLPETHGILVTQEGLERVYRDLTGCSGSEATEFRGNIAKKKMEKVEAAYPAFMERASQKIGPEEARKVWDMMVTFGRYGFNLSHAVAYAITAYACAWLKHHFPLEWWTAVLKNEPKKKILEKHWSHCKHLVLPPDVRYSRDAFCVEGESIRMPLSFLQGVGESAHAEIVEGLPYENIEDFCKKVYERRRRNAFPAVKKDGSPKLDKAGQQMMSLGRSSLHSGVMTKLILSGVMDSLFPPEMLLYEKFMEYNRLTEELKSKKSGKAPKLATKVDAAARLDTLSRYQARKAILPVASESLLAVMLRSNQVAGLTLTSSGEYRYSPTVQSYEGADDLKVFWDRIAAARIQLPSATLCHEGANLRRFEKDFDPKGQSVCVGAFLYVQKVEPFTYVRNEKTQRALRVYADSCGEEFVFVAWPDRKTGKQVINLEGGEIIFAILSRYRQDKGSSVEAAQIIKAAPKDGEESSSDVGTDSEGN
jgi:DNA polymerase-3 subunit alpha